VTPTTKAVDHDVPISPEDIVAQGLVSQQDWDTVSTRTFHLAPDPPATPALYTGLYKLSRLGQPAVSLYLRCAT